MPKFTVDTKFLSHTDISDIADTVVTIQRVEREVLGQGSQAQEKWVIYFREIKKGLALNKTNGKILVNLMGSDEMNDWVGQKIALYVKDDVEFQGDVVSAIRIRVKKPGERKNAAVNAMDLDAEVQKLTTVKGCMELMRSISVEESLSEEDREALLEAVNLKMAELKAGK